MYLRLTRMSWGVSSRNVSHEDYDCVLRLPDLVRKCTWHTGVRRCAYDETSMHKAGKEAKGERKILG